MKQFKEYLLESSLSRLWKYIEDYDVGTISAFRGEYTKAQNMTRTKEMKAALMQRGYSVTQVKGSYIENFGSKDQKEVGEVSFFVADHKKSGTLEQDLKRLGEKFDQDSILFVPNKKDAKLIGTSKRENSYPGYGKTETIGKAKFGKSIGQFFSRVGGRVFTFESVEECIQPDHIAGKRGLDAVANRVWSEINQ